MTQRERMWSLALVLMLGGCASTNLRLDSNQHVQQASAAPATSGADEIPQPVQRSLILPAPKQRPKTETYSVVVDRVPVQELLFALARDAKVNVDIQPGITGTVTLNALDQTLPQLLTRIARQVDLRFEIDGANLSVMPDTPFLRNYRIDYVNLTRDTDSTITVASQIGASSNSGSSSSSATSSGSTQSLGSGSFANIKNSSKNHFWDSLVQNIKDILRETDKVFPEGSAERTYQGTTDSRPDTTQGKLSTPNSPNSSNWTAVEHINNFREAASVIANIETGVISVRATSRQQEKIQEFIDSVRTRVKRQVLIDVTVAEVQLSQNYQQGIDWTVLNLFDTGLKVVQQAAGSISGTSSNMAELDYTSRRGNFTSTVKLLDAFGTVKILSSPKLSVLNNQTAVMKVVDDNIYFTYDVKETDATTTTAAKTTVTSTLHTVPVGLVLSLTPQIGDDDSVTLNIRPSISRVIGQKTDPSLGLYTTISSSSIQNTIPIIRSREFDSVMRVTNGNIAVMGGLMEDLLQYNDNAVPGISNTPWLGGLFQNRDDTKTKTELVIFVRPTIIRDASLEGDFSNFRKLLPDDRFFDTTAGPRGFVQSWGAGQ